MIKTHYSWFFQDAAGTMISIVTTTRLRAIIELGQMGCSTRTYKMIATPLFASLNHEMELDRKFGPRWRNEMERDGFHGQN